MKEMQQHLSKMQHNGLESLYPAQIKISVGRATCGRASGSEEVMQLLEEEVTKRGLNAAVCTTGCLGFCQQEPLVSVHVPGFPRYVYGKFNGEKAEELINEIAGERIYEKNLLGVVSFDNNIIEGSTYELASENSIEYKKLEEHPFYKGQLKIATRNCGLIDPWNIEEYTAMGGYRAVEKVLGKSAEEVIDNVKNSGLRGRGGGGFPTGVKWEFAYKNYGEKKYVICNADEGDPGAYMDRSILEGDPHSVIEGMIIGGYAIGADTGIIYCRAEYPLAVKTVENAIEEARENGFLGENIFGSGFNFDLKIVKGAGAFVCGEETALIASIEGKMGEPRPRPPFPAEKGLWGYPTVINNVETWSNIPPVMYRGSEWYSNIGTEKSKGTKVFALVGDVKNNGLVEVPMGTSINDIVHNIGSGCQNKLEVKAVQMGGPSGGCVPNTMFDLPVDYEKLTEAGTIMGSGGMVVMNERSCMVDVARFFMQFARLESCGKCVPCREGNEKILNILEDISKGRVNDTGVLDVLEDVAVTVKETSLCGLGQTAPNPVLSTLRYFKNEFYEHINEKFCSAGICKNLFKFVIDQDRCVGCGRCAGACPQEAIHGEKGETFEIEQNKCIKCRVCFETCHKKAVIAVKVDEKE